MSVTRNTRNIAHTAYTHRPVNGQYYRSRSSLVAEHVVQCVKIAHDSVCIYLASRPAVRYLKERLVKFQCSTRSS